MSRCDRCAGTVGGGVGSSRRGWGPFGRKGHTPPTFPRPDYETATLSARRPQASSKFFRRSGATGLTRWWSKPASLVPLAIVFAAPAGHGDHHGLARRGTRAQRGGTPRSRPCRAGRCRTARRRACLPRRARGRSPSCAMRTRWPMSSSSVGEASRRCRGCPRSRRCRATRRPPDVGRDAQLSPATVGPALRTRAARP